MILCPTPMLQTNFGVDILQVELRIKDKSDILEGGPNP